MNRKRHGMSSMTKKISAFPYTQNRLYGCPLNYLYDFVEWILVVNVSIGINVSIDNIYRFANNVK